MDLQIKNRLDIIRKMRCALSPKVLRVIKEMARFAEAKGYKAYLVGGFVRDLLIGVKNLDIDIVIEGDALRFAEYASSEIDAVFLPHKRFATATFIMRRPRGIKIDLATARRESYKRPAELPSVKPGTIEEDLYRRDFTINAIAVSINRDNFGELIDFFGGVKDITEKRIRVLHKKSFIDDPTRIFRAVRFEARYGFKIDPFTAMLIRKAVKARMFDKVSGERLRREIELLLQEKDPVKVIMRMKDLDETNFISPRINLGFGIEEKCRRIKRAAFLYDVYLSKERPLDIWLVYFMALIDNLTFGDAMKVCGVFMMKRSHRLIIASVKKYGGSIIKELSSKKRIKPSAVYSLLKPFAPEALLFITAKCAGRLAEKRINSFLKRHKWTRISIKGDDIKRFGKRPGPHFTEILQKTLYAKIDGLISTKQEELRFAKQC